MGKISDETKREILAATDIVELINPHVKLRRAGAEWKGICPFHHEKTPSFSVSQARGRFHCFGCGEGGDAIAFIQKIENITFPEALKYLADRANIKIVEDEFDPEAAARERRRSRLKQLFNAATDWFHDQLLRDRGSAAQNARDYLRGRGIDRDIAKRWRLGFAPPGRFLLGWAQNAGFEIPLLVEAGLVGASRDRPNDYYVQYRNRLIIPIEDELNREVIAFSARVLDPNDRSGRKYMNSPEHLLFKKSKVLFGLGRTKQAIIKSKSVVVCEGQLDLITCVENGIENVVASQGTAFTEEHAKTLKRNAESEVVLCFDADNAGYKAAKGSYFTLSEAGLHVRVVTLPEGEDPDSLIRTKGPEAFIILLEESKDFFDFQIDFLANSANLSTTRGRLDFASQLADSAAKLSNPVARDAVIHKVANRLKVPAEVVRTEVEKQAKVVQKQEFWRDRRSKETAKIVQSGSPTVVGMCHNALTNSEFATFLRNYSDSKFLEDIPGTDLLSRIWEAEFDARDATSVSLFIDSLPDELRAQANALVVGDGAPPDEPMVLMTRLEKERVSILIKQVRAQMEQEDLDPMLFDELFREHMCLSKESLDLERRLKDISPLY